MSATDYAGNFADFLAEKPDSKPFCFWLGTYESHRGFQKDSGTKSGKHLATVRVPAYLPDNDVVRGDLLDYLMEVEDFDSVVGQAIDLLEKTGQLDKTLIVVTSDHGMPFPRAKASLYDAGSHVPLAMRWPAGIKQPGRQSDAFVNLSDLATTFLAAAKVNVPDQMTGRNLSPILTNLEGTPDQTFKRAFIAMERHDGCRAGGKGYPCRAIRTDNWLYIKNYAPERWPAGDPDASVCARAIPFGEVDSSPSKSFLMEHQHDPIIQPFYELAFQKRPAEELYRIVDDPDQINNLAGAQEHVETQNMFRRELETYLLQTQDPRLTGEPVLWDYYPYYGLRKNKDWKVAKNPLAP
jgi:uncharacterized sulfatase